MGYASIVEGKKRLTSDGIILYQSMTFKSLDYVNNPLRLDRKWDKVVASKNKPSLNMQEETIELAKLLREKGMSFRQIAKRIGRSASGIRYQLQKR